MHVHLLQQLVDDVDWIQVVVQFRATEQFELCVPDSEPHFAACSFMLNIQFWLFIWSFSSLIIKQSSIGILEFGRDWTNSSYEFSVNASVSSSGNNLSLMPSQKPLVLATYESGKC